MNLDWLLSKIAAPVGVVLRPVLAAIIGTIIGLLYDQAWIAVYKVAWLHFFVDKIIERIDPLTLQALTPQAIGAAASVLAWAWLGDWIIARMRHGNTQVQKAINDSPFPATVKVDGIITKGGETATAISRMAYEAVYPTDTETRPSPGMPEVRRPLPND